MLVLLWGLAPDNPLSAVREQLRLLGVPTRLIDQSRVLETEVDLVTSHEVHASVRIADEVFDLDDVTAVYLRNYDSTQLQPIIDAGPGSDFWQHAACADDLLACWTEITPAFVVNRCSAMAGNNSKPYQLRQICDQGWSVPATLVTTDPQAAQEFWERHESVVYKSVSGIRSRVSRLTKDHLQRFQNISTCPTQFQQYISGTDHRVHVVGNDVFACEVECDADDYRYPGDQAPVIRSCSLPAELEDRCRKLAAALQLPFAGIDLRRTPAGEWFCFEVNPSPGFTYYESATGLPIARAVARLLADPRECADEYPLSIPNNETSQRVAKPVETKHDINQIFTRMLTSAWSADKKIPA